MALKYHLPAAADTSATGEAHFRAADGGQVVLTGGRRVSGGLRWQGITSLVAEQSAQVILDEQQVPVAAYGAGGQTTLFDLASPSDFWIWQMNGEQPQSGLRVRLVDGTLLLDLSVNSATPAADPFALQRAAELPLTPAQVQRWQALAKVPWLRPTLAVSALALARQEALATARLPAPAQALAARQVRPKLVYLPVLMAIGVEQKMERLERQTAALRQGTAMADLIQRADNPNARRFVFDSRLQVLEDEVAAVQDLLDRVNFPYRHSPSLPADYLALAELVLNAREPGAPLPSDRYDLTTRQGYAERLFNLSGAAIGELARALSGQLTTLAQTLGIVSGSHRVTLVGLSHETTGGASEPGQDLYCTHERGIGEGGTYEANLFVWPASRRARLDDATGSFDPLVNEIRLLEGPRTQEVTPQGSSRRFFSTYRSEIVARRDAATGQWVGTVTDVISTTWNVDSRSATCTTVSRFEATPQP